MKTLWRQRLLEKIVGALIGIILTFLLKWFGKVTTFWDGHATYGILTGVLIAGGLAYAWVVYSRIQTEEGNFLGGHGFVAKSKKIDMIATTFEGFGSFEENVKQALEQNNAVVRVLLLHRDCPSFHERSLQYGDYQLPEVFNGQSLMAAMSLERLLQSLNQARAADKTVGTLEWKFYRKMPTKGAILTDVAVRYWPYFSTMHQAQGPTLTMKPWHPLAGLLKKDFDRLWNDPTTQDGSVFKSVAP